MVAPLTYSPVGAIIVLAIALYPVPMLATEAAVRRIESRLEEAALLVDPVPRVLTRITVPILWPRIIRCDAIAFVATASDQIPEDNEALKAALIEARARRRSRSLSWRWLWWSGT